MAIKHEQIPVEDLCRGEYRAQCAGINSCTMIVAGNLEVNGLIKQLENANLPPDATVFQNARNNFRNTARAAGCPFWATLFR